MKNRIQKILKQKRITAIEFAKKIGVQRSSISHILSGRNKPSLDFITKIIKAYPDISYNWLIEGREKKTLKKDEKPIGLNVAQTSIFDSKNQNYLKNNINPENIENKKPTKKVKKVIILYENSSFEVYES